MENMPKVANVWQRRILEEGTAVNVTLSEGGMNISISPSISVYSHHQYKRVAASICFEIAAKYAEKVGGEIIQRATVTGCHPTGQTGDLILARYPLEPINWDHICNGFRELFNSPNNIDPTFP